MAHPVAESREISAPAERVWAMVSDLPRIGQWSPENQGGHWVKGGGPAVGSVFSGHNRNGVRRWSTKARVIESHPGKSFEIVITFAGFPVANWRYDFEDTAEGCRVTESWRDNRAGWQQIVGRPMGDHSAAHARKEMAATLGNLAKAAEGDEPTRRTVESA